MRTIAACILAACWFTPRVAAGAQGVPPAGEEPLRPWATNTEPTDVPRSKAIEVTQGTQRYTIVQGGTLDGRSCRSPMGCGMAREGALFQTWESNRSVRMENVGETDVINPWLSNGRNNFRTVAEIANAALAPGMTDAEKAFAIWFQQIQHRHHAAGDNNELGDPVKVFNVYGYNTCGNDSIALATLWRAAGLKAAPARALGHCISQVFYEDAWHFFDGDLHSVYLLRDNQTVASEQDIVRDHDLIKRTHSQGILFPDTWWQPQGHAAMYFSEGEVAGQRSGKADTAMNMVLRPSEAIVWRWGQLTPVKYHGMLGTTPTYLGVPHIICNGLWEYRPDLTKDTWRCPRWRWARTPSPTATRPPAREGCESHTTGSSGRPRSRRRPRPKRCIRPTAGRATGRTSSSAGRPRRFLVAGALATTTSSCRGGPT